MRFGFSVKVAPGVRVGASTAPRRRRSHGSAEADAVGWMVTIALVIGTAVPLVFGVNFGAVWGWVVFGLELTFLAFLVLGLIIRWIGGDSAPTPGVGGGGPGPPPRTGTWTAIECSHCGAGQQRVGRPCHYCRRTVRR